MLSAHAAAHSVAIRRRCIACWRRRHAYPFRRRPATGQLLRLTLQHEAPELEARKAALQRQQGAQRLQLAELERQLLQALAASR